jgi:hypothetical protein
MLAPFDYFIFPCPLPQEGDWIFSKLLIWCCLDVSGHEQQDFVNFIEGESIPFFESKFFSDFFVVSIPKLIEFRTI